MLPVLMLHTIDVWDVFYSLDYARRAQPKAVVVQSARGLIFEKHAHILSDLLVVLKQLDLVTSWRVLDANGYGIP